MGKHNWQINNETQIGALCNDLLEIIDVLIGFRIQQKKITFEKMLFNLFYLF